MTQAMTETERNEAIVTMMALNEQVHELEQTVAQFPENASDDQKEITADLSRVADSLAFELRDSILELVRQNLGPQQQENLMHVLRLAGEWLEACQRSSESVFFRTLAGWVFCPLIFFPAKGCILWRRYSM